MDKKYEFNFTQMKISEIMAEVIKTAGLVPEINFEGLEDQVIDFSTATKSESDDEGSADYSNLPEDICKATKQIIKGAKSKKEKAQRIYDYVNQAPYESYNNTKYGLETMFKRCANKQGGNCCDHAHVSVAMLRCAGIKANYAHESCIGYGHVYAYAYIPNKTVFDPLGYARGIGTTRGKFKGNGMEKESIDF